MITKKHALICIITEKWSKMSITEAARRCDIHPDLIDRFVRLGLFEPPAWNERKSEWIFDPDIVPLVRKILRLRNDLGINYACIGVVLDLLSRIERHQRLQIQGWIQCETTFRKSQGGRT